MSQRTRSLLLPTLALSAAAWLVADHVVARGSGPDTGERVIPYSGRLELDGNGVSASDVPMRFTLRGVMAGGGEEVWSYGPVGVDVAAGAFSVRIGEGTSVPDWVYSAEQTYVAVEVNGEVLPGEQRIYPVPFATWAAEASDLVVSGSLTVGGPVTATSVTSNGDIRNMSPDGQVAPSTDFAFRDTGDTWLRLRRGAGSNVYADLAVGRLSAGSDVSAQYLSTVDLDASGDVTAQTVTATNDLCVEGRCGSPYITCTWSGERAVHGDEGCGDDVIITCSGGRVTHMRFSC